MTKENKTTGSQNKKKIVRVIGLLTLLVGGASAWYLLRLPATPEDMIEVSGRIESDSAAVAAKTSGRIREMRVREGDSVKAGDVLAVLDDVQLKARVRQAQSEVEKSEAKLQHARAQVAVLQAQLDESHLNVSQARIDADGRVAQAKAHVASAEASLARAEADAKQSRSDAERYTTLANNGDAPAREGEQARNAAEAQRAVVDAARKQVDAAKGALLAAEASLDNPAIRAAQGTTIQQQIRQAQSEIGSMEAELLRARAELEEAQANQSDLEILAPFEGTIATRAAEPGEVVAVGTPIATIVNLNQVYLRAFIPEGEIGRVRTGQLARVFLDSNPKQPFEAFVSRIDPQASFTPENTYFRDDRVKQVVGVKLEIKNPQGFAKPGMPADGAVLIRGEQWDTTAKR